MEVRPRAGRAPFLGQGANSYQNPAYGPIESQLEQQYGLPTGIMAAVRTRGERSNADQVSSAGARSVYQVTPATRAGVIKNYGVDAYQGPTQAAHAAALLLREGMQRNGGDPVAAIREYHGGTNPANWGPVNRAYVKRTAGGF